MSEPGGGKLFLRMRQPRFIPVGARLYTQLSRSLGGGGVAERSDKHVDDGDQKHSSYDVVVDAVRPLQLRFALQLKSAFENQRYPNSHLRDIGID